MSLLTQASLIVTPNAVKASKLYSVVPSNGNGDMDVVRATTAIRTNSLGIIESVASNVPRLNYEAGSPSILIEPQRTNLLTYSEMFSNVWTTTDLNTSGTPAYINQGISPDNALTADKIIPNTTNSAHRFIAPIISVINGSAYTFSVFMKRNDFDFCYFRENINGTTDNTFFNLSTITLGTVASGRTAKIENYGNGWIRCSITATTTTTSITVLGIGVTNTNGNINVIGDNVKFNFLWGAQLELGAYLTSYVPTVATSVTRNADVITRNNIYTNNLITSAGGTWFIELNNNLSLTRTISGNGIWIGDNNTSSTLGNSLNIRHNGGTARLNINKTIANTLTPLYTTLTNTVKIAIDWNGTTADVFVNGVKVTTATSFTNTNMEFLNTDGVGGVPKYIKSMMLFPKPLTDQECIALTTL